MKRRCTTWLLLASCLSIRLDGDTLVLSTGEKLECKLSALGGSGAKYEDASGKAASLRKDQVLKVSLSDSPPQVSDGDEAMERRDFDRAIAKYNSGLQTIAAGKAREMNRPFIWFKLAAAYRAKKKYDECLRELQKLREEGGDCFLREESYTAALDVLRLKKDDAGLLALLGTMKKEGGAVAGMAELDTARMQMAESRFAEAQATFERLAAGGDRTIAPDARLWNIRALRALKRVEALEAAAKSVIEEPSSNQPALLQACHASMGSILLDRADKDAAALRLALLESLHAVFLGPPPKDDSPDDFALATLTAARANVRLARSAATKEQAELYLKRASGYYKDLVDGYSRTDWGQTARAEAASLGVAALKDP